MCAVDPGDALGGVVGRVPGGVPGTSVVVSTSWKNKSQAFQDTFIFPLSRLWRWRVLQQHSPCTSNRCMHAYMHMNGWLIEFEHKAGVLLGNLFTSA